MTTTYFYVWCDDRTGHTPFNVAVCKSEKEADATRGFYAATQPDKTFTITKETL